ncbi:MAG: hypothetical protein KKF89_03795 [Nanoarchaeota archaeon]|nr:hypothetical protein [Nanoarchaeota archaeon]MBU1854819.1 hypothetical protein [Nanoarchaeota archaeon]
MGKRLGKWGWAILAKGGALTVFFLAYAYHNDIKKLDYNLFNRNVPIAENGFKSPAILEVDWEENDSGAMDTYLVNNSTGKKLKVLYDMLPSTKNMLDGLKQRFEQNKFDDDSLDSIIDGSFELFKSAQISKHGENYNSIAVQNIQLLVAQDENGKNNLYLSNGVDTVMVDDDLFSKGVNLNFGKYEQMLGADTKNKINLMFTEYLDNLYRQYETSQR